MKVQPVFTINFQLLPIAGSISAENRFSNPDVQKPDTFERSANVCSSNPSFGGFSCATDSFAPRNLYDIPCSSCGEKTLLLRQIDSFVQNSRDKKGEELIEALKARKQYYKKTENKVVAQIIQHLKSHPEDDLSKSVRVLKVGYLAQLETQQNEILDKVKKTALKNLSPRRSAIIARFVDEAKADIQNAGEVHFKRKDFLARIERYARYFDKKSAENFKEVLDIAKNLPTSSGSVPAFFVKYSRRSNDEIARRLILPAMATTEHIMPRSLGGPNRSDNFMVMCGDCNSKRQSMPYTEWLKIQPSMIHNFGRYITEITDRIRIGELGKEYATYPAEVCKTVEKQSRGAITAQSEERIGRIVIDGQEKPPKKTASFEDRLTEAEKKRTKAQTRLLSLKDRQRALQDDPEYGLIIKYYRLGHIIEEMYKDKKGVEDELYGVRKGLYLYAEHLEKKEECETVLKNPKLTRQKGRQTEKYLYALEAKLQQTDIPFLETRTIELEEQMAEIDRRILSSRAIQEQYLPLVNMPETLAQQIKELRQQKRTQEINDKIEALIQRRVEIQEKIRDVRIDQEIEIVQKEFNDANTAYQNLLAGSSN